MSETPIIKGELRTEFGKGSARRLRRDRRLPGVLYGKGQDNLHFHVDLLEMQALVRRDGSNAVLDLELDGEQHLCMVRVIDQNVLTLNIDHIDLLTVKRGEKVEVHLPVVTTGNIAPGGQLLHEADSVLVLVDPLKMPEELVVNVEGLTVGTQVLASDLPLTAGMELVEEPDTLFLHVTEIEDAEVPEDTEAGDEGAAEESANQ